ncbi:MAG: tetratricopeptide repeat protein [Bryobacteraceae bacterium]|jgi:tetratricopeptide (TPR) repeat protein
MVVCGVLFLGLLFAPQVDYVSDGLKALDANRPDAAEPLFRKAVEAEPSDYGAHFNLALALSLQHKDAEAVFELRKTLELKPRLYEGDLNLGTLLLRDKQPADALPVLKEAAETKPKEVRPNLYYAEALLATGDAAQAAERYTAVLAIDPKSNAADLGLARALLDQAKLAEAAEHFHSAGSKNGLLEVAAAYEKARRVDEAIAIYKEFPDDSAVREHLGMIQIDNKEAAAAIPDLEEAMHKSPTTSNRLALADAYRLNKQPAKAIEQLQLAVASDPNNYDLRMQLGRILRDERRLIPASEQFSTAAKLKPDSVQAWHELASAAIVGENYAVGLAALDKVRALGQEIPGDFFLRAITLDKLKQKPQALAAYRQFLAADNGLHPDQEFQSRARIRIIENELKR